MSTRTLCLALCALALAALPAEGRRGKLTIVPPTDAVVPSGSALVTVRANHMKVVRLYCEGLYQGRRDLGQAESGADQSVTYLVQFPQIAKDGRWVLRAEGTDIDGDDIEPVMAFVSPTRDRDVRTALDASGPGRADAPSAALYTTPVVVLPSAPEFTLTITPAAGVIEPGGKLTFTTQVFQRGVFQSTLVPTLEATAGTVSKLSFTAPDAPGRVLVLARYGDGVAIATIDVGKSIAFSTNARGLHQVRVSNPAGGSIVTYADPNRRGGLDAIGVLLPANAGKRVAFRIEGLDDKGEVVATSIVEVEVR